MNTEAPESPISRYGRFPYADQIEAALNSGTTEQRLDKIALFLAVTTGSNMSDVTAATVAQRVEREVMVDRPARDPRSEDPKEEK